MSRRILFYVQHLLGIGHLKRAATLARAFAAEGLETTLISGGFPVPGLDTGGARFIQLPPTRATDIYFKQLVDERGTGIDDAWKADRCERLLALFRDIEPDVLIVELYPFGRRQMRFELTPLLEAAKARPEPPVIVSSVRDILVAAPKPERNMEMVEAVERFFDHVLVHGDPGLIPFAKTFPLAARIEEKLHHTGYVTDRSPDPDPNGPGNGEVIVSAGGGAVGDGILTAAIDARPLSKGRDLTWRVLVGINLPEEGFKALQAKAGPGLIVERARPDFARLLGRCRLSISQGGYNTVMEVLQAGCRAVVVPYAGGLETEQTLRADLLAQRSSLVVQPEETLTPQALAAAADRALDGPALRDTDLDTDGLAKTLRLVKGWAGE